MIDDADLAARFGDSVETAIQERHDTPAEPLAPKVRRKATRVAKAQIWNAADNIKGVLHRPLTPEEIARFTGQLPEIVGAELCRLESQGLVERADGGKWKLVLTQ